MDAISNDISVVLDGNYQCIELIAIMHVIEFNESNFSCT